MVAKEKIALAARIERVRLGDYHALCSDFSFFSKTVNSITLSFIAFGWRLFFMRIDAHGPRQLCYELCIISVLMGYSLMNAAPTVNERWQQTAKSKKRPLLLNKTKWHLANHTIPSRPHTRCWNLTTMKMNVKMKEVHSVFFFVFHYIVWTQYAQMGLWYYDTSHYKFHTNI